MRKIIFFALVLISCQSNLNSNLKEFYDNEIRFTIADFRLLNIKQRTDSIKLSNGKSNIFDIAFVQGYTAILTELPAIYIFNNRDSLISTFDSKTSKNLKIISPWSLFSRDDELGVYDLSKSEITLFKLQNDKWTYYKNIPLTKPLQGLVSINSLEDGGFVGTSLNNITGKALIFGLEPNQIVKNTIGNVPKSDDFNDYITGMQLRSSSNYSYKTSTILIAHYYTDLIDSYSTNGDLKFRMHGPDYFEPEFAIKKLGKNQIFVTTAKTKRAYKGLVSDDRFIYALYNGEKNDSILIFTLDGKPFGMINSMNRLRNIKIDSSTKRLYLIKEENNTQFPIAFYNVDDI